MAESIVSATVRRSGSSGALLPQPPPAAELRRRNVTASRLGPASAPIGGTAVQRAAAAQVERCSQFDRVFRGQCSPIGSLAHNVSRSMPPAASAAATGASALSPIRAAVSPSPPARTAGSTAQHAVRASAPAARSQQPPQPASSASSTANVRAAGQASAAATRPRTSPPPAGASRHLAVQLRHKAVSGGLDGAAVRVSASSPLPPRNGIRSIQDRCGAWQHARARAHCKRAVCRAGLATSKRASTAARHAGGGRCHRGQTASVTSIGSRYRSRRSRAR